MNLRHAFISPESVLFRVLDGIADATNLLLLFWLLAVLVIGSRRRTLGWRAWLASLLCIAVVYLVKEIEEDFKIWKSFSSDYSTHSALAAALVISLCFLDRARRGVALAVFAAYELLIVLLGFHSILDVVSTLLVVVPLMLLCQWYLRAGSAELAVPEVLV